jgi:TPR repeat protein
MPGLRGLLGRDGGEDRLEHVAALPPPVAFRAACEELPRHCRAIAVNHPVEQIGSFGDLAAASGHTDRGAQLVVVVPPGDRAEVTVTSTAGGGAARREGLEAARAIVDAVVRVERDWAARVRAAEGSERPGVDRPVLLHDYVRALHDGRYGDARRFAGQLWDGGDPRGALRRAMLESEGRGGPEDPAAAARWYAAAADAGEAEAAYGLGALHALGRGVEQDWARSMGWYRRAWELGLPDAAVAIAFMHARGEGVPADRDEAVRWLRRAGAAGSAAAPRALAGFLAEGGDVPGAARRLLELVFDRDDLEQDARQEAVEAFGQLVGPLSAMAETGDAAATAALGWAYLRDGGSEALVSEGQALLRRAAAAGDPTAHLWLGKLLAGGFDGQVAADPGAALAHWRAAAEAGNAEAQLLAGLELHLAEPPGRDPVGAERLLRAAAGERPAARIPLAEVLGASGRRAERAEQLRLAAEGGQLPAMTPLAEAYRDGDGIAADAAQAVRWYLAALARGDGTGMHELHRLASGMSEGDLLVLDRQAGGDGRWAVALARAERPDPTGGCGGCADLVAAYESRFGPLAFTDARM